MGRTETKHIGEWSAQEIADRLGISSAVFQKRALGTPEIAQIREAGIAHLEISSIPGHFNYRDRRQIEEIVKACKDQGMRIASFHTALFPLGSACEQEREKAVGKALILARTAVEMGAGILSCHLAVNEQARRSIVEMLEQLQGMPMTLAVENVGQVCIKDATCLVDEIASDRFKMLLDIGHERDPDGVNPFVKGERARAAVAQCGCMLCGVHLHETFAIAHKPDHRPPLHTHGIIEWGEVFAGLRDVDYRGVFLFEDGRGKDTEAWVRAVGEFPVKYVERYGIASPAYNSNPSAR